MVMKVMIMCQGNICRSAMGKYMLIKKLKELDKFDEIEVFSAGLEKSTQGSDMENQAKIELDKHSIPYDKHSAHMIRPREFLEMDYVLYMEDFHRIELSRIMSSRNMNKAHRLLDYTDDKRDIDDPYYTGDFITAYNDIDKGLDAFIKEEIIKAK